MKDIGLMKNNAAFFTMILIISVVCSVALKNPFFALGYATALISIFSVNTIAYDEHENGMAHLFSLPISRKLYVKEKYVFSLVITVIGLCIACLISAAVAAYMKESLTWKEWGQILSLSILATTIIQSVILPVRMRFDAEKHKMAMMIAVGVLFLATGVLYGLAELFEMDVETIYNNIMSANTVLILAVVLVFAIITVLVSYKVSVTFLEKREF